MDDTTRQKLKGECLDDLQAYRLTSALTTLRAMTVRCSSDELKMLGQTLTDNYSSMLNFISSAGKDRDCEQRQFVFIQEALRLLMQTDRVLRIDENKDRYSGIYSSLKEKYGDDTEASLLRLWKECADPLAQSVLEDGIFHLLFTSPLWKRSDTAMWYDFLVLQNKDTKLHLMGALFLSVWEYPDEEKTRLLYECANDKEDAELEATAVTYLLLLAYRHRNFPFMDNSVFMNLGEGRLAHYIPDLQRELAKLSLSVSYWKEEQKEILALNARGTDTFEHLAGMIRIKLRYEKRRIEDGLDTNIDMVSQTCHSSAFLKDVSHWFVLVRPYSPIVLEAISSMDRPGFSKLIDKISLLWCDIDLICFVDIVSNGSMKDKIGPLVESASNITDVPGMRLTPVSRTVRNLYRFFAHSLFSMDLNALESVKLWQLPYMRMAFTDDDKLAIAKLLHSAGLHKDALALLNELLHTIQCDAKFLALMAECEKDAGNVNAALQHYKQAELLDEDNIAYLENIQACLAMLGRDSERLEIFERLHSLDNENHSTLRNLCILQVKSGHHSDALKTVMENIPDDFDGSADFFAIAMDCALVTKRMDVAKHYLGLLTKHEELNDRDVNLWTGYFYITGGNWKEALYHFRLIMASIQDEEERTKYFNLKISHIVYYGVSAKDLSLIRDIVLA